jgi:hypothetical protein
MGFLRDDNEYQYAFYPVDKGHESIDYSNVMTLDSLLDRLNNKAPLSRRQRFHIAVLLSVSVLQLFSTPWLTDLWNKEKVLLLWTEDDSTDQTGANQVYVKADPISQISSSTDSTKVIFALGVMLLELCFGQKLEEHPNWDKYLGADGKANEHTEFATAREWQAKVTPEAGPEFAEAVRKCLLCAFATKGTSLEDDDFRNAFYTGVVRPVQDYWRFGYGNASWETY